MSTTRRAKQRAFCVGIEGTGKEARQVEREHLDELRELLRTAGAATVGELVQRRERPHPNLYLGQGKVEEVKELAKEADANMIVCDDELTPRQERNLEQRLGLPVVDRTALILDIFAGHAHTAEGKLQTELAQLEYNLARMRGLWTHLERLGGGIGTRGPGESQIETDRRLARSRITRLRKRLEKVSASRELQRRQRTRAQIPTVALAGYTNAGKSTLQGALCKSEADIRDRLFHTLDPTTRVTVIEGQKLLVTDTVGFIRKLPHSLVEAFAATLEETKLADLIVHVADASASEDALEEMLTAVNETLDEIGATTAPRLLALNKIDLIDEEQRTELRLRFPKAVLISASEGEGFGELRSAIKTGLTPRAT